MTIISFEEAARRLRRTRAQPATPDDWSDALQRMRLLTVSPENGEANTPPEFQECIDEMRRINDAIGATPILVVETKVS